MSATLNDEVQALKDLVLHNPVSEEQGNIQGLCVFDRSESNGLLCAVGYVEAAGFSASRRITAPAVQREV